MTRILPIFISLGWGATIGLFAFWLFARLSESYAAGSSMLRHLETTNSVDRDVVPAQPLFDLMEKLAPFVMPTVQSLGGTNRFGMALYLAATDRQLRRAGLRDTLTPEKLFTLALTFALVCSTAISLALILLRANLLATFVFVMIFAICFSLPGLLLSDFANKRILMIEKRLPFAIEFMLLTMQANTSFPTLVQSYCDQFDKDPLSLEFRKVLVDIGLGASFTEAIGRMATRLQCDDITAFVSGLDSGIREGQPMQEVLKVQADAARNRRFHNAEQIAKAADANATPFLVLASMGLLILLLGPLVVSIGDQTLF